MRRRITRALLAALLLSCAQAAGAQEMRAQSKSADPAADSIAAYGASLDPEDPQFYNDAQSTSQMRGEIIQSVAQFDPKLALEYLRSTRLPFADALRASGYQTDAQEQQLE